MEYSKYKTSTCQCIKSPKTTQSNNNHWNLRPKKLCI